MKKWYLLSGILIFGLGLSFVIFPPFWSKVVVILLALGSIAYGIYNLVYTKKIFENTVYEKTILIKSIASLLIGFVALIFPLAIGEAVWSAMIIILIIYLIISAFLGFYAAALLKNSGIERKRYFLENLVLLAVAVVLILISPEKLRDVIMRFIGIVLMVGGVGIAVYSFFMKETVIKVESDVKASEDASSEE
ncbi:MAG: hypothetical protein K6A89_11685 [Treponema sp.]|nr:hypothetical protein [Treponema sp.]